MGYSARRESLRKLLTFQSVGVMIENKEKPISKFSLIQSGGDT